MMETVRACKAHSVAIGAHPGLPDLQGFGRREMKLDAAELTAITIYQVGALQGFLAREGVALHHVKPHGVLYGMMCRDYEVARAVMLGIPQGTPVFGLAGTCMEEAARDLGVEFWAEMYGDVKYAADGMLVIDRRKKCVLCLRGFLFSSSSSSSQPSPAAPLWCRAVEGNGLLTFQQALETRGRREARDAAAHDGVGDGRRRHDRSPPR